MYCLQDIFYHNAQEDEKEKTLSRFIWKLKIMNGNEIFVSIDEDLFRKTELKQTPIKPEILKKYWDLLKLSKGFLVYMALGAYSYNFPLTWDYHKNSKEKFMIEVNNELDFLKGQGIISSYEAFDLNKEVKDAQIKSETLQEYLDKKSVFSTKNSLTFNI